MGTYLSKDTSLVKFSQRSDEFFRDMSQIVVKCPSRSVEKSFQKFTDPKPDAEDCQIVTVFSLSKDRFSAKFSVRSGQ